MRIKLIGYYILILAFFILKNAPISAQITSDQLKSLDKALTVLHEQASFNGVVLVAENGKSVFKKALGITNLSTQEPLKTSSAFNLASVSKQFVAMMVMQLHEKSLLKFDDKVQLYLPDFSYEKITIRQLLTHTSGLPEYFDLALR